LGAKKDDGKRLFLFLRHGARLGYVSMVWYIAAARAATSTPDRAEREPCPRRNIAARRRVPNATVSLLLDFIQGVFSHIFCGLCCYLL
jgi:hypothetical protein